MQQLRKIHLSILTNAGYNLEKSMIQLRQIQIEQKSTRALSEGRKDKKRQSSDFNQINGGKYCQPSLVTYVLA